MQIKILEVGAPELKQGPKAKYSTFKLSYAVDGKARDRKIMSFDRDVYGILKAAQAGEFYDVETVKEGEFWNWKNVAKVEAAVGKKVEADKAEAQAEREVRIVRQSTLGYAVNALGAGKTPDEYFGLADAFASYVWDVPTLGTEDEEVSTEVE